VLGNHDEKRVATRLGRAQAPTAMTLLLTLRGTPTMYYGDELGHPDVPVPPEKEQDPWGLRVPGLGLSRDPARTPMPWTDEPGAGFTVPGARPWLPIVEDTSHVSVVAQEGVDGSMLELTRRLLEVRRAHPALTVGSHRTLLVTDAVFAYERAHGNEAVLVAANLTGEAQRVPLGAGLAEVLVSTAGRRASVDLAAVDLAGHEAAVMKAAQPG
jgi:alpha-glucosidase